MDLSACEKLLDVGGGTGAFSMALCRRYPKMTATIVDFPNIRDIAERLMKEAGLADRVTSCQGDALTTEWPEGQDVILMSYLLSAMAEDNGRALIKRARVLKPDGLLILHDFMIEDERTGPTAAALWLLAAVLMDPDAPGQTPRWLSQMGNRQRLC